MHIRHLMPVAIVAILGVNNAKAGSWSDVTNFFQQPSSRTSFSSVLADNKYCVNSSFPTIAVQNASAPGCVDEGTVQIDINQFARESDLSNFAASTAAQFATLNYQLTRTAWIGSALAASLTAILPTDGNQNHINLAGAAADGVQAVSLNYAHVEGHYDFIAGAAIAKNYSLAKIGVGFSW